MSILNQKDENSAKSLKFTSFLQQLKLSDANIVFYDVQHKHQNK